MPDSPKGGRNSRPGGNGRPGGGAGTNGGPGRSDRGHDGQRKNGPSGTPPMRRPYQPPRPKDR